MRTQQTFTEPFDELYRYYNESDAGKKMLKLEGISRDYLDVGMLSKAYFTEHVPDMTSDANANANEGICPNNYQAEIVKGISKLDGYFLLFHYASKRFGPERATELVKAIWRGDVYFHDATKPQVPYSYFGDTTIIVKICGQLRIMTMRDLFMLFKDDVVRTQSADVVDLDIPHSIVIDTTIRRGKTSSYAPVYIPIATENKDIEVWNGIQWVKISKIIKHPRDTDMVCIGTDSGKVTVVTDNHPVILRDHQTKDAKDICIGDQLLEWNDPIPYAPKISVNKNLAYVMGMIAGDGHISQYKIELTQKDNVALTNVKNSLDALEIKYKEYYHGSATQRLVISGAKLCRALIKVFNIDGKSYTKRFPTDIIQWDKESIAAYLAGLFDAEGTINLRLLYFRSMNAALSQQFAEMIKIVGCDFCNVHVNEYKSDVGFKASSNVIYVVSFRPTEETLRLLKTHSSKLKEYEIPAYNKKMSNTITNSVDKVIKITSNLNIFDDVYDITVDGEQFYSGGLIQHNCFAFSTSMIMHDGRRYGQLQSLPPKRADSFIAQVTETSMDLSQEFAGAIAPSDIIINFAWYAKNENLSDHDIVNRLQSFVHVMNNKFRVSAECVDAMTEVLTPHGFKKYDELNIGDDIYVWNNGNLEVQHVDMVNISHYVGEMHNYCGRDIVQTVTPNHRVLRMKNNHHNFDGQNKYELVESSKLVDMKTPVTIPIATTAYACDDYDISDAELQLVAIVLCDGHIDDHRVTIYKSPSRFGNELIKECLEDVGIQYTTHIKTSVKNFGISEYPLDCVNYYINKNKCVPRVRDLEKTRLPDWIFGLSRRQANLFIDTWAEFDGHTSDTEYGRQKLQVDNYSIADQLQHLCVIAGRGSRITERVVGTNKRATIYVIPYIRTQKSCSTVQKIKYDGIVWCPSTDAGVVIYRKDGKVFISGNSPFSNISLFDRPTLTTLTKGMVYPDTTTPDIEYIIHIEKVFGEWFATGDPATGLPYRFPIVTINLSKDENGNIIDQDFLDWTSRSNLQTGCFNIYINDGFKIASCCRLTNDIERMRNFKGDSFGNGGLNLGSHRVVTINLPRIALKAAGDCDKFKKILNHNLEICRDLLQVHREEILERRINVGFLKFFKPLGWFSLEHMFSTIGIVGVYECAYFMDLDIQTDAGSEFVSKLLLQIEDFAHETSMETGHSFNVEEIPAESVAVKLCDKDKVLFGEDKIPFNLYSNQYIPLIASVPMPERIQLSGKFMDLLSGGGIVHLNVKERITDPSVMKHLIEFSVANGVSHLAINYGFGRCIDGHTTVCGNSTTCPQCGKDIVSWMTRVIGYFSIVANWNKVRREYEFPRREFS